jgi:hypothetical protein
VRICRAKLDEEELLQWQAIYGLKRANIDIVSVQKYTHVYAVCLYFKYKSLVTSNSRWWKETKSLRRPLDNSTSLTVDRGFSTYE